MRRNLQISQAARGFIKSRRRETELRTRCPRFPSLLVNINDASRNSIALTTT